MREPEQEQCVVEKLYDNFIEEYWKSASVEIGEELEMKYKYRGGDMH